jgi:VRR-NUC domain
LPFAEGERAKPLRIIGPDEAFIRKAITDYLDLRNVVYAVTDAKTVHTADGPRQLVWPEGWPDITAILPVTGQIWAIEVKTENGKLREAQEDMLALISASGGLVTVARDCLVIRQILNEHLARYRAEELSIYLRTIIRLKQIFHVHAAARATKKKSANFKKRLGLR